MKERGILMSGVDVPRLLDGTKTQTRREVKHVHWSPNWGSAVREVGGAWIYGRDGAGDRWSVELDDDHLRRMCTSEAYGWGAGSGCPYGVIGDRLYVKEAWRAPREFNKLPGSKLPIDVVANRLIGFEADGVMATAAGNTLGRYRHARFMPRWASRITLEITYVRVDFTLPFGTFDDARVGFEGLWDAINGAGAWSTNPWCWVLTFARVSP